MKHSSPKGIHVNIEDMIEFAKDGIVSKTLIKASEREAGLFCMSTGQALSTHTSSFPAIIHVLQGKGNVTLAKETFKAERNDWFYLPAKLPHAVQATENLVFLLTLFKRAKPET